jgi:hypothetical protein
MRYWVIALCVLVFGWGQMAAQDQARGEQLLLCRNGTGGDIVLWDVETQSFQLLPDLQGYSFYGQSIWSIDGRYLLSDPDAPDQPVQIYDVDERHFLPETFGYEAAWSPDGTTIAFFTLDDDAINMRSLHLYNWASGADEIVYTAQDNDEASSLRLQALSWSPNSQGLFFFEAHDSSAAFIVRSMILNLRDYKVYDVYEGPVDYPPLWSVDGDTFILNFERVSTSSSESTSQNSEVRGSYQVEVQTGEGMPITAPPPGWETGKPVSIPIEVENLGGVSLVTTSPSGLYQLWYLFPYGQVLTDAEGHVISDLESDQMILEFMSWRPPSP